MFPRVDRTDGITAPIAGNDLPTLVRTISQSIGQLAQEASIPPPSIDACGLGEFPVDMIELATAISDRTGLTMSFRFSDRDRIAGGRGGPLKPATDWLLHRSNKHSRLLVDIGPTTRVTHFPAQGDVDETMSFDAGPGTDFLDVMMNHFSDGRFPFDPSGHFAVQGRTCPALIEQWASHPFLLKRPPRFVDLRTFGGEFVDSSIAFAREQRLSAKDVLCSASHWLAQSLREAVHRFVPDVGRAEVILTGGGLRNGMLRRLVAGIFTGQKVTRLDDCGIPGELAGAVHYALLAYMAVENLPANIPALTGAQCPRVLGTIVPGSSTNWDRWVCHLADRLEWESKQAA